MRAGFGLCMPSRLGPGGPQLGPEIAVNGDFTSDSGWSLGTNWQIGAGFLFRNEAAGSSSASQASNDLIAGALYRMRFTVSGVSGSDNQLLGRLYGGANSSGALMTGNGVYEQDIVAPVSPAGYRIFAVAGFAGLIDNFSIRRVL